MGKREHIHLYGTWEAPYEVGRNSLWIFVQQRRRCTIGSQACGDWLYKNIRLPRNNLLSRESSRTIGEFSRG